MNKIIPLTILSLAFAVGFSAEGDKPLPKAAADVVAELNASKMLATQKAVKKLQVVMGDLTRRGDLDGANATKALIEGLQKGLEENAVQQTNPTTEMIGKWLAGDVALTIFNDGTWASPWKDFGGTWRLAKGQLELTSNKGNNQIIYFDPKEGAKWTWNGGKSGGLSKKVE
jgi:hypothetical protein